MVSLNDITKYYPTRQGMRCILDKVNFTLRRGDKLGILGCNGAGKSTLIRIISGVELPSSGTIEQTMSISWPLAFQGGFVGSLTGLDNLRFVCRVYDIDYKKALAFVEDFSELGCYLREPIKRYSAGMRARLAFGISMAVNFDCYLIDEVTAVGDKRFNERCQQMLFNEQKNRALIMVSHFPGVIREYCNRFSVLAFGKLHLFDAIGPAMAFYDKVMETQKFAI